MFNHDHTRNDRVPKSSVQKKAEELRKELATNPEKRRQLKEALEEVDRGGEYILEHGTLPPGWRHVREI